MANIQKQCDRMFNHKTNLYNVKILDYYRTSLRNRTLQGGQIPAWRGGMIALSGLISGKPVLVRRTATNVESWKTWSEGHAQIKNLLVPI